MSLDIPLALFKSYLYFLNNSTNLCDSVMLSGNVIMKTATGNYCDCYPQSFRKQTQMLKPANNIVARVFETSSFRNVTYMCAARCVIEIKCSKQYFIIWARVLPAVLPDFLEVSSPNGP